MIQLKDVIHYYIGQDFEFDNHKWNLKTITPIYASGLRYTPTGGARHVDIHHHECKLILRRLEDMTEEEVLECAKQAIHESDLGEVKIWWNDTFKTRMLDWGVKERRAMDFTTASFYTLDQFDWLLKKGFDLFDLIHYGQAIDAKTLKQ